MVYLLPFRRNGAQEVMLRSSPKFLSTLEDSMNKREIHLVKTSVVTLWAKTNSQIFKDHRCSNKVWEMASSLIQEIFRVSTNLIVQTEILSMASLNNSVTLIILALDRDQNKYMRPVYHVFIELKPISIKDCFTNSKFD